MKEEKHLLLVSYCGTDGKNRYLLHKRDEKGLLAGLWEIPAAETGFEPSAVLGKADDAWEKDLQNSGLECRTMNGKKGFSCKELPAAKHVFSHVEWHMNCLQIQLDARTAEEAEKAPADMKLAAAPGSLVWAAADEVESLYTLPSAFKAYRKYIK